MHLFVAASAIAVAAPAAQAVDLVTVNGKTFDLDQFSDAYVVTRLDGSVTFDGKLWDNFVGVDPLTLGELAAGQFGGVDPGDQISLNDRSTPDWLELNYPSGQTISSATEFVVFEITSSPSGVDPEGLSWKIGFNGAAPVQVTLSEVSHFPSPDGVVEDTNMGVFNLVGDFGFSPGDMLYTVRIENVDSGSGTSDPDFIFGGVTYTPAPPVPTLSCSGFQAPLDKEVVIKKPNRVLPLRMNLLDGDGNPVSAITPPVVNVEFVGTTGGSSVILDELTYAGKGNDGNQFVYNGEYWAFNLSTKGLASGSYMITAVSGDIDEYVINPTCEAIVVIE